MKTTLLFVNEKVRITRHTKRKIDEIKLEIRNGYDNLGRPVWKKGNINDIGHVLDLTEPGNWKTLKDICEAKPKTEYNIQYKYQKGRCSDCGEPLRDFEPDDVYWVENTLVCGDCSGLEAKEEIMKEIQKICERFLENVKISQWPLLVGRALRGTIRYQLYEIRNREKM